MKGKELNKCIISIINGQGNMELILSRIKKLGTEEDYEKIVNAIQRNARYRKMLSSLYTNQNVNDIFSAAFIPSLTLFSGNSKDNIYKDVLFMVKFLLGYEKLISDFYVKKAQFEAAYLSGNLPDAARLLDEVYNATGISYWYIEMKLLLLNDSDYEMYRKFYESLKNSAANDLVLNHIRLIKRRVNMRTSQNDYCEFFNKNFSHESSDHDYNYYRAYLDFMYTESPAKLSELQIGNLTTVMHNLTLIDTVLFVERFLLNLVCVQKLPEYQPLYDEFKCKLNGNDTQRGQDYHTIKLLFCNGEYEICSQKCEALLVEHSDRFEITDIYVKTLLVLDRSASIKKCPLLDMVSIMLNCYLKKDGSAFGATFMDKSNQMLRALSSFDGYYELLNIISNTMYIKSTTEHPYWDIMVRKRPFHNAECDLLDQNISNEGIISCDWSYSFYKKAASLMQITRDEVSERLKTIRDGRHTSVSDYQECEGLDRIYFEEEIVIAFHENMEKRQYLQAVQIYAQVLVEDILLATRCDVERLSDELTEDKCKPLLSDLSFYIFAATTDLNKQFRDTLSQTLFDSFHAILTKYGFNAPSNFINVPFENKKLLYKFLELCCDENVLMQSPCDLYGKEKLQEQEKLLNYLYKSTRQNRYRSMLDRVKADLAEFNVRNTTQSVQLPREKLNTDWLSVEYDSDVASAYDQLRGFSYEQISEDDDLFNIFKAMFYRCKEKYLVQVNKQLGTFIRHGVFINRIVEFLKKYDFFFPTGDEQEDEERLKNNQYLQIIPIQERISVFQALQKNCLDFFRNLETIVGSIYFTSEESSEKYTPIYIKSKELKERIRGLEKPNDDLEFIESIKILLDKFIEDGLPYMRKRVENCLGNAMNQYFSSIRHDIPAQYYAGFPFDELMQDFPEEITHIGEWFQIINDSKQKCSIDGYLQERNVKYPDICFNFSTNTSTMRLSDLILLDIIMENLIRNVESHSGFSCNYKEAETEITVEIAQENKYVEITAKNRLNGVNAETLQNAITKINAIIPSLYSGIRNSENSSSRNSEIPSSTSLIHGVGLYNLGYMMYKACKDSSIFAKYESDVFFIRVAFSYGGCD